jgi:hypothetical protein
MKPLKNIWKGVSPSTFGDGRAVVPSEIRRVFFARDGAYQLDGKTLIPRADHASRPERIVEQIRHNDLDGPDRFIAVPIESPVILGGVESVRDRAGRTRASRP